MAAVQYTNEQLNYFRVCYVTTKIVPDGLRTVFKREWDTRYQASHGPWQDTSTNGNDFFHLESPRNQKRNSRLLAVMNRGNTYEWDCTCLFYAILYSDSLGARLNPLVMKRIDDLRDFRNGVFAHTTNGELTDADFQAGICKVETAFSDLKLGTAIIDDIKNQTSFPTKEVNDLQKQLVKEKQQLDDVTQELNKEKKRNEELVPFCVLPSKPSHKTLDRASEVKQVMQEMQRLKSTTNNEVTVVYLSGNPGCGKSQVARQVGERFFSDLTDKAFVFTFNASNEDVLLQSYLELASRLRCDADSIAMINAMKNLSKGEKLAKVRNLVTTRIEKYSSWLMILDNVSKLKSVCQYLPQAGDKTFSEGQILVTTQNSQYIPVDSHTYHFSLSSGMQPDDAVAALTEISGLSSEEERKLSVAKALDFQPLALACAAVYMQRIRRSKPSWETYLQQLEKGKRENTERVYRETSQAYPSTMTQAVKLAVANEAEEEKAMMHAFQFLSTIAPEPIPLSYVVRYVKNCMPEEEEGLIFANIFSSSLILCCDDDSKDIRVHQVIHKQLQTDFSNTTKEAKGDILSRSIVSFTNINLNINEVSATDIRETRILAQHFAALAEQFKENLEIHLDKDITSVEQTFEHMTSSLTIMSNICLVHGMYPISKICAKLVLDMKERVYDEKHPGLATTLGNLGLILQDLGQYEEAKTCLERALAIEERVYDEL